MHKIQSNLMTFRQRLSTAPLRLPRLSSAEQTKASWAKNLKSYSDLPPVYHPFFSNRQAQGLAFPYTLLLPAFEGFFQRSPEKLIVDLEHAVAVLEKSDQGYLPTIFPLSNLCRLEWRVVLLDGRLQISGLSQEGAFTTASLRFNAVTDYLLAPLVERMRRAAAVIPAEAGERDASLFAQWSHASYKFMNYARRSLLPGEQLVQAIFQPEISRPVISVLGRTFYRTLAPALALILTDRELILIREEAMRRARVRYGGTWDYLPLGRIDDVNLVEKDGGMLSLTVALLGEASLENVFEGSRKREVMVMLGKLQHKASASA